MIDIVSLAHYAESIARTAQGVSYIDLERKKQDCRIDYCIVSFMPVCYLTLSINLLFTFCLSVVKYRVFFR